MQGLTQANEKYMGDALLQKTYTVDCLTKKRVANDGTVPQYYVNNDHEAIIPRELFARVQEEMKRRANIRQGMDGKRRVYSSKYELSNIVFCGHCGDMYRRTHWNNHGKKQIVWRCVTRLNAPGVECPARTLSEIQLQNLVLEAINKVLGGGKQRAIKVLETNISEVVGNAHAEELDRIKEQIEKQQTLLVKMTAASEDYSKVVDKIYALQKEQFGGTEEMFRIGISGLRINFCITPVLGFVMLATTFFQSINRPAPSIIITVLRQIVFIVPFIYILPILLEINGIFFAQPISDLLATALSVLLVLKEKKRMMCNSVLS